MKRKFFLFASALLLGLSLSFYACDGDDDDNNNNNNNNNTTGTCSDGVKNQGETGVDCGGPCLKCEFMSANIDGSDWEADQTSVEGRLLGSEIFIQGSKKDGSSNIQLVYEGIWNPGTYTFKRATYSIQGHQYVLTDPNHSSVTFTTFTVDDPSYQDSTMTGTFTATLVDTLAVPMDTVEITNGNFTDIYFNK